MFFHKRMRKSKVYSSCFNIPLIGHIFHESSKPFSVVITVTFDLYPNHARPCQMSWKRLLINRDLVQNVINWGTHRILDVLVINFDFIKGSHATLSDLAESWNSNQKLLIWRKPLYLITVVALT